MLISHITHHRIDCLTLPEKAQGVYTLPLYNPDANTSEKHITIEGTGEKWLLKTNKKTSIKDAAGARIRQITLEPSKVYRLLSEDTNQETFVCTDPITEDRQTYTKYIVGTNTQIRIGRQETNDIVIAVEYVSACHALLTFQANRWFIQDTSSNGTFVNCIRIKNQALKSGDVIYIMGCKIIIGGSFIALNNPDGNVSVFQGKLMPFLKPLPAASPDNSEEEESPDDHEYDDMAFRTFYRSPRFKRDIEKPVIKVDAPPQNAIGEETPFMLVLGPSLTMGMASASMAIFTVSNAMNNGNIAAATPSIVMSMSMMLGVILWPILSKKFDKKRRRKKETLRQEKYSNYLSRLSFKFKEECTRQEEILRENYVPLRDCIERIQEMRRNLWERGPSQNDFLQLRLGLGSGELDADINFPEKRFTLEDDNLQEELHNLCEEPKELKNIPITLSLFEEYITGIIGNRRQCREFAQGLIFQLAAYYSYDEVKMVFLYDPEEEDTFYFTKWLPHVWNNDHTFRFIASSPGEVKEVSAYLEKEIEYRSQINESDLNQLTPYYVIFSLSQTLSHRADMLKQIYARKNNLQISVLTFYDKLRNLPKECHVVAELEEYSVPTNEPGTLNTQPSGKLYDRDNISDQITAFTPDIQLNTDPVALSIHLSNIRLDTLVNTYKLPKMITFLELYSVGKIEHLNALARWRDNDPTKTLEAAVGVDILGEPFKLDLHENFHGPHGLVAGMTGSGKSEFVMAYILSLAVSYHPHEVAFILIDYKGGGMAKSFENLPHTAGIITNLDGAAIKRSLVSIQSELKRRQAIFAQVSKTLEVSNIDIYKYQKLYREGSVSDPLQHLFIISDEFAELKREQPDFMAQLVSAARIGRSLGVHLILATQKPSGVVDDQIWSNSRFRVCLKVQDKADSQDMLKRPDAAELTDTGRFYLQVGYNELFEMGQSAWAGAPYYPADRVIPEKDDSVVVIDKNGRPIRAAKPRKKHLDPNAPKQLDAITGYLSAVARSENICIRPLWLDPIPGMILIEDLKKKYADNTDSEPFILNPVIGEYDDPARQRQALLRLPLSTEGNVIIYGSTGSGKTTFLSTLVYSLIQEHTPEEVNIYLLDFSSETLHAFNEAPHIGSVIFSSESEKILNLFKMLKKELIKRKKNFADYGGSYTTYIQTTEKKIPSLIIGINNYTAFKEMYGDQTEQILSYLAREGVKYGIIFILTVPSINAVFFGMRQNFKQLLSLQLNDESDYAGIVGKTDGLVPSKHKGRGLIRRDNLYEFQIAHITADPVPFAFLRSECQKINQGWNGPAAARIPILPEIVDTAFLKDFIDPQKPLTIPIGVEQTSLKTHPYPFGNSYINIIMSADENEWFFYELARFIAGQYPTDLVVIDSTASDRSEEPFIHITSPADCEEAVAELYYQLLHRHKACKEAMDNRTALPEFPPKIVMINSVSALKNILPDKPREESTEEQNNPRNNLKEALSIFLQRGDTRFNMTVILAEQEKNMARSASEAWYKDHITGNGIWLGSGIAEQYYLKSSKTTADMRGEIPHGFGYSLLNGKAVRIKLLYNNPEETEEE